VSSGGVVSGATISGGILEIASGGGVASSTITFASGASGTLQLDGNTFRGKIAGLADASQVIDLRGISYNSATTTLAYSGNTLSGILTVNDGTHVAKLALMGQYVSTDFTMSGDGHSGTLVWDPPVDSGGHLAPGH